jgi:hypothetical protein
LPRHVPFERLADEQELIPTGQIPLHSAAGKC